MKFFDNLTQKQKQHLYLAIVIGVAIGGIFLVSYLMGNKPATEKKFVPKKKMSLLTEKVEKDLWVASEGQNIKALEKSNTELRSQIDQLRKEFSDVKTDVKTSKEKSKEIEPKKIIVNPPLPGAKLPKQAQPAMDSPLPFPAADPAMPHSMPHSMPQGQIQQRTGGTPTPQQSIRMFKEEGTSKTENKDTKKDTKKQKGTWLPSGSFMKAVLLNGIDAPTNGGAQSEPYPVVMTVTDLGTLPNRFKMNLKECFVIGAGYGNLSDERAYIRTETLSCVRSDGKAIDVPLKGHIVGGDGKLGVRGRLISKQGQQIALSIFAGTIGGLGQALRPQQALALNLNPNNTGTVYPNTGDVMLGAGMGGASNALNRVADYYLKMAEKLFPIIEIDAGRPVEVIILKGQELAIK